MNELDLPGRQLETGHIGDPSYEKALELMTSRGVALDKLEECWFDELPTIDQCSEEKRNAICARVQSANEILPRVRDLIYRDILLKGESGQTKFELDEYLLSEDYPKKLGFSQREYQIAAAHVIFRMYAEALSNCPEPDEEKHFGSLMYFGAVHDLLVGIQTGKSYFVALAYQGEIDFSLIEKINIPIVVADDEEVLSAQMKVLLEGGGVTPLKRVGKTTYSILGFKPDSEKEE